MFKREFTIKKSSGAFITKGLFYLLMIVLSLLCCLFPKLYYLESEYTDYIVAVGYTSCFYFSFIFIYTIYRGIKPANALVLTENGLYDFINYPGKGIFVNWENVTSVKIFGSQKSPILGIELYDTDILIETLKKSIGEDMRSNIEAGLPAITIKQSSVTPNLSMILPAFNDFLSLARPIPTANISASANKVSDETTDEQIIIAEDKNPSPPSKADNKTLKSLKKAEEAEEIFVLPPQSANETVNKDKINNKAGNFDFSEKKETVSHSKPLSDITKPLPAFSEFVMESEPVISAKQNDKFKTKELPAIDKHTPTEHSEKTFSQPKQKQDNSEKNQKEIKTLDDLLSTFSIPTNSKNSKE